MASQPFDPSQQQTYQYDYNTQQHNQFNQSAYYQYQTHYYHQPQYYYANQSLENSSIHPPGVPIPGPNCSISSYDYQNHQNGYYYNYPNAGIAATDPYVQPQQIVQPSNAVANGTGYSSSIVSGQGRFITARGQEHATPITQGAAPIPVPVSQFVQPASGSTPGISNKRVKPKGRKMKSQQPCQPAYCELCKVDCNSLEIFEQHKNGKKHQKNLKAHKELQTVNKVTVELQMERASGFEHKPEIQSQFENFEESNDKQFPLETPSSVVVGGEVKTGEQKAMEAASSRESAAMKRDNVSLEVRGNGSKRKMIRNGKGVKWLKSDDGSKKPVEPPKPNVVPLICELCNVKCESPVVFQTHLTGKKHLANLKRFHGEQAILGQAAVEALYPALQVWYPALQALFKGDMSTLISELQQQGYLDAQGQPAPSNYFQGQGSEVPPAIATLSEIPQQQSDLPPEGSGTATTSQVVPTTEGKSDEQSAPVPAPATTGNAENEILESK